MTAHLLESLTKANLFFYKTDQTFWGMAQLTLSIHGWLGQVMSFLSMCIPRSLWIHLSLSLVHRTSVSLVLSFEGE